MSPVLLLSQINNFSKMRTDVGIKQNQMDATIHSAELIHKILTESCGLKHRLLEGHTYDHWLLTSYSVLLTQFLPAVAHIIGYQKKNSAALCFHKNREFPAGFKGYSLCSSHKFLTGS